MKYVQNSGSSGISASVLDDKDAIAFTGKPHLLLLKNNFKVRAVSSRLLF